MTRPSSGWRVFGAPAAIGMLTLVGLFAGLLWGEAGHILSWACAGSPVMVASWVWLRAQLTRRSGLTSPARYRRE